MLTFNEIVPVMPFALNERLTVPTDFGAPLLRFVWSSMLSMAVVQRWVSIMLAVYGAAQLLGSRKLSVRC